MKKQLIILGLATMLLGSFSTIAQDMSNAGTYMGYFSTMYKPIQKDMWDYTSAVAKGKKARKIEKQRQALLQTLAKSENLARRAKDWDGDAALRDQVVDWLNSSQIILNEEYGKIMDMEEIAEQSYDNMEAYIMAKENASEHMGTANDLLSAETKRFAADNDVTLIEDDSKLTKKLERANKAFAYYNDVFLIFFKSNKQDAYLTDAINSQDVNAIEQNKNSLAEFAKEGRTKIKALPGYEGDGSLKLATDKLLRFYEETAEKDVDVILEYFLAKENFEKVKTSFEAIKASKRTQEDVDQYNNAINDFNNAVNEYNAVNDKLNKLRTQYNEEWNKAVDRFLSKNAA